MNTPKTKFKYKDLTGRGIVSNLSLAHILANIASFSDRCDLEELEYFLQTSEDGDEFQTSIYKLIHL